MIQAEIYYHLIHFFCHALIRGCIESQATNVFLVRLRFSASKSWPTSTRKRDALLRRINVRPILIDSKERPGKEKGPKEAKPAMPKRDVPSSNKKLFCPPDWRLFEIFYYIISFISEPYFLYIFFLSSQVYYYCTASLNESEIYDALINITYCIIDWH